MATAKKSPLKKPRSSGSVRKPRAVRSPDALALLRTDHKTVSDLFARFEKTRSPQQKQALCEEICTALTVHAQIEEEIFYPAVQQSIKDRALIPEARVEHESLKTLIAQVQQGGPEDEMFDARMQVLSEYVKHHVKEEQNEIFPKVKAARLDTADLGVQLEQRKQELMAGQDA